MHSKLYRRNIQNHKHIRAILNLFESARQTRIDVGLET
jgi:hypothetical protein